MSTFGGSFPTGAVPHGSPLFDGLRDVAIEIGVRAESILRSDLAFEALGVHALRVSTKRLRAYWQLLKPIVEPGVASDAIESLRVSARALAGQRDEHVLRELLLDLATHSPGVSPEEVERAAVLIPHGPPPTPADHHAFLAGLEHDIESWRGLTATSDDELLERSIRRGYKKARKLGRKALEDHDAVKLHRWRRWVKYLRYQVEPFARPEYPFLSACRDGLDELGSTLGSRNDYHNLATALAGEDLPTLTAAIRRGEATIVASIPGIEDSVLALEPRQFLDRLAGELRV